MDSRGETEESKGGMPPSAPYLDYNRRKQGSPLVKCEGDLAIIPASVAQSFRSPGRSASDFTFRNGEKRFRNTVFR